MSLAVDKIKHRHRNEEWWHRDWYCEVCKTTIKRHHKARHLKGKGHVERSTNVDPYEMLPSDKRFQAFLDAFDVRRLKGYERQLYNELKRKKVRRNEETMQPVREGDIPHRA